tara:strand:- start:47 stop:859 length:813 start_codon:yes stop_codon:yes gene_type:complete
MTIGDKQEITKISIKSAINQTLKYKNFIFVIDTITREEGDFIYSNLKDIERSIILKTNRVGPGMARQVGVNAATSKYMAFLDYDDIWHPRKLELQISLLEKEQADFSFTSYKAVNIDNKNILFHVHCKRKLSIFNLLICDPIGLSTVVCRRNLFQQKMQLSHEKKRWDYITWFKLFRSFNPKQAICSDYLTLIVKRSNSISSNYWNTASGVKSMINAFHKLGFDLLFSYFITFLYSFLQIFVKLKRITFKYILPKSKNVKDYQINKYLNF